MDLIYQTVVLSTALSGPGKLLLVSGQSAAGHVATLMWLFTTTGGREGRREAKRRGKLLPPGI